MRRVAGYVVVASSLAVAAACEDPSAGKAKAQVSSAAPVVSAPAPAAKVERLSFSNDGSKLQWTGSKVTGKHDGSFERFTGTIRLVGGDVEKSEVKVEIDMSSVASDTEKLTGHLKTDDFFGVEKYPKARFVSTAIKKGGARGASHTVTGNLTLRGVTKSITFPATIALSSSGVTVKSEFSINRKIFGINYPGKKDDLIRDNVVIKLDLAAKRG